ncbi:MAG: outer membrane beta-barrel protein [Alistipes sp.]|nr:outer membrane beta-barrel protein [Alistipes sp.]
MKKFLLAIVAVVATCSLSAQELKWGVTGGFNFANEHMSAGNSSDCYIGFNLGVKAVFDLSDEVADGFYADGRALYTLKGGQWKGAHNNLGYVEVPLNFGYSFSLSDNISLFAGLGPYFALGVAGSNVIKTDSVKTKTKLFGNAYKRFDWGLNYNVGVDLWGSWQVFMGFEHGFVNVIKSTPDVDSPKMHPLNFYIGTAYMF